MSHIKNQGIIYIANGTNPNSLGLTPVGDLGIVKTQDGTQEWNYNVSLVPGSRWVLNTYKPYKVYKALLTQSGTDAPVATVLENTLGGNPIYVYVGNGNFEINGTGLFDGTVVANVKNKIHAGLGPNNEIQNAQNNTGDLTISSFIINGNEIITTPLVVYDQYNEGTDIEAFNTLLSNYCTANNLKFVFFNGFQYDASLFNIIGEVNSISINSIETDIVGITFGEGSVNKIDNGKLNISSFGFAQAASGYLVSPHKNNVLFNNEIEITVYP